MWYTNIQYTALSSLHKTHLQMRQVSCNFNMASTAKSIWMMGRLKMRDMKCGTTDNAAVENARQDNVAQYCKARNCRLSCYGKPNVLECWKKQFSTNELSQSSLNFGWSNTVLNSSHSFVSQAPTTSVLTAVYQLNLGKPLPPWVLFSHLIQNKSLKITGTGFSQAKCPNQQCQSTKDKKHRLQTRKSSTSLLLSLPIASLLSDMALLLLLLLLL